MIGVQDEEEKRNNGCSDAGEMLRLLKYWVYAKQKGLQALGGNQHIICIAVVGRGLGSRDSYQENYIL